MRTQASKIVDGLVDKKSDRLIAFLKKKVIKNKGIIPMSTEPLPSPEKSPAVSSAAIVAMIIGIAAIVCCGYLYYLYTQNNVILEKNIQAQTQQLQAMQKTITHFKNNRDVQQQSTLADVTYLVHLANLQLTLNHDPKKALATLQLAQQNLSDNNTTALKPIQQALSSDIAALNAVEPVNTYKIFSELSALNIKIQTLSSIPAAPAISVKKTLQDIQHTDTQKPWKTRMIDSLKALKNLFVIRHVDQPQNPLMTIETEIYVKQNIAIQLNMAQWALLHRDQAVYQSALQNVSGLLTQYFAFSAEKNTIDDQLTALAKTQFNNSLPTLHHTLTALSDFSDSDNAVTTPSSTNP